MEDWAEIRRLHRSERLSGRAIAKQLGISRNTVAAALASSGPPKYERAPVGSAVDSLEPEIRRLLEATPTMPATVIAERVGWDRGMSVFTARVRELRPFYLPPDPSSRTTYQPGERMQCDLWFPPADIPLGHGQVDSPPVLVMTAGYSRVLDAVMIPTRTAEDLIAGHWQLLNRFGAVPRELVWDQEGAVGQWRRGKPVLTEAFEAFRGMLGTSVRLCRARRPQAKGLVERNNDYYERSFLPGRVFTSPGDFNTQIAEWITVSGERAPPPGAGLPADRAVGDRQGRDAAVAAGRPGTGLAALGAPAPGSLRADRRQRLLGRPAGDRPPRRGGR